LIIIVEFVCFLVFRSLDTKKGYKPPVNAKQIILDIVAPIVAATSQAASSSNQKIESTSLGDANLKYKVLRWVECLMF